MFSALDRRGYGVYVLLGTVEGEQIELGVTSYRKVPQAPEIHAKPDL